MRSKYLTLIAIPLAALLLLILVTQSVNPDLNPPAEANSVDGEQDDTNPVDENPPSTSSNQTSDVAAPLNATQVSNENDTQSSAELNTNEIVSESVEVSSPPPENNNQNAMTTSSSSSSGGGKSKSHSSTGSSSHINNNNEEEASSNDDTTDTDSANIPDSSPKTWLRVDEGLIVGSPVTAYLLTTYNGPASAEFRGFHDPDCSNGSDIPCETVFDSDGSTSPTFAGEIPGACEPCFEYKATFSPSTFVLGENHIDATIWNGDENVATVGGDFTEHSFFVIPESPVGIIGLVGSTIAAFAVYFKFRVKE